MVEIVVPIGIFDVLRIAMPDDGGGEPILPLIGEGIDFAIEFAHIDCFWIEYVVLEELIARI